MHVPTQAIHCRLIGFEKTVGGGGRRSLGGQLLRGSKGWLWTDSWLPFIGECQEWIRWWLSWWTQVAIQMCTSTDRLRTPIKHFLLLAACDLSLCVFYPSHYILPTQIVDHWSTAGQPINHCTLRTLLFVGIWWIITDKIEVSKKVSV